MTLDEKAVEAAHEAYRRDGLSGLAHDAQLREAISAYLAATEEARHPLFALRRDAAEEERDEARAELKEMQLRVWSIEDAVIGPYNAELEARARAAEERVKTLVEELEKEDRRLEGMRLRTSDSELEYLIHEAIRNVTAALARAALEDKPDE